MCSISGAVNYHSDYVTKMCAHQFRRGPDNNYQQKVDNVEFGHNLLAIIGNQLQPVSLERYMMTFNGCWYDYRNYYPNEKSDTVALLRSFEENGIDQTLKDINGMFAIGLYDKLFKKLHLIVDRFAQKNLYYYHEGNKFAFASTPAALLQFKEKWEIDKDALNSYWLLGSVMGSDSIWRGIKKVCASEWLTLDIQSNEINIKRYWEPHFQSNTNDIEELTLDAINKVKISDVPVHIFLSGGIDSTLVASQCQGIEAIHLESNEVVYAELAAQRFGIKLKHVSPQDVNVEESLMDYSFQAGEPTMAGLIPYITAKETSKFGKVAIIANGADELFNGYNRTHDLISEEQLTHTYRLSGIKPINGYPFSCNFNSKGHGKMWELNGFVQFDLNKTLDFASGCHGLEVRSPFLDHRLVEMALSIPETKHREYGNKTILKRMLRKFRFNDQFLNRPKIGFSLHKTPYGMDELIKKAVNWCLSEGWLRCNWNKLTERDKRYLEMSCLGFYFFYRTWENKIA